MSPNLIILTKMKYGFISTVLETMEMNESRFYFFVSIVKVVFQARTHNHCSVT